MKQQPDGTQGGYQPDDPAVAVLAEIIGQAHAAGIRAGAWSLARWIVDRWPRAHRATVPEAIRDGTTTSRQAAAEIMALVDELNPPAALRARIQTKVAVAYASGMVSGRAARQHEIEALQAAIGRHLRHGEEPA